VGLSFLVQQKPNSSAKRTLAFLARFISLTHLSRSDRCNKRGCVSLFFSLHQFSILES